jgi:hypothetical protein
MTDQALRARTVGELVDAAFSLYRQNAPAYVMVAALASVPGLVLQLLLLGDRGGFGIMSSLGFVIVMIISLITYALMNGVLMRLGAQAYLGGEIDVARAVREVMPKVGRLISVAILRVPLYFLGFIALVFGVFYVFARYFAAEAAVVLEDQEPTAAFRRSTELSRNLKWHILGTLGLGFGIYFILAFGVAAVTASLGIGTGVLNVVLTSAVTMITYPIIGLLTMLLYYDARIRNEGFDVEYLARVLEGSSTGPAGA